MILDILQKLVKMKRIADYYISCPKCGLKIGKSAFKALGWVKHRYNSDRMKPECIPDEETTETD